MLVSEMSLVPSVRMIVSVAVGVCHQVATHRRQLSARDYLSWRILNEDFKVNKRKREMDQNKIQDLN